MTAVVALGTFLVAFFFIATERGNKVKVVLIAAAVMAVTGLSRARTSSTPNTRASTGMSSSCCWE